MNPPDGRGTVRTGRAARSPRKVPAQRNERERDALAAEAYRFYAEEAIEFAEASLTASSEATAQADVGDNAGSDPFAARDERTRRRFVRSRR